jgi:hypothetical protein
MPSARRDYGGQSADFGSTGSRVAQNLDLRFAALGAALTSYAEPATRTRSGCCQRQGDHSLKFSNPAGTAGVPNITSATNSAPREHITIDALNFLCV